MVARTSGEKPYECRIGEERRGLDHELLQEVVNGLVGGIKHPAVAPEVFVRRAGHQLGFAVLPARVPWDVNLGLHPAAAVIKKIKSGNDEHSH